jgi:hypothetical protein
MADLCKVIWCTFAELFRSRASLQAEMLVFRRQLNVPRRKSPARITFFGIDRLMFAGLCGLSPSVLAALQIVKPDTAIRWHRVGFRTYWRWKSRSRRSAQDPSRNPPAYSQDEHRQSALGRAPHSRRITQARHRRRADHGGKIHGDGSCRQAKAGRPSYTIMLTALPRWICSWCRQFRFGAVRLSDPATRS